MTAKSLGLNIYGPELMDISKKGKANLVSILNTLSKDNREWFAYTLYSLLSFYGKPDATKKKIAFSILNDINISENDFYRIVEYYKEVNRRFMQ